MQRALGETGLRRHGIHAHRPDAFIIKQRTEIMRSRVGFEGFGMTSMYTNQ
jgi:hypothetical protein